MTLALHSIWDTFRNPAVGCALLGWLVAQALKAPLYYVVERKWDFHRLIGAGGMPSSHSAMVVALALMVGFVEGFETSVFAICMALALVVMYDAAGVRRETGTQAAVINRILRDALFSGKTVSDEELKELVGHTPLEVMGGMLVGIMVAMCYWALWIP